ncbi:hypothetical protein [Mesorhizobium silamurunense]|uniref:hypothetical protein n=1 Tax=Mesorhizobium silamurunense TaxID=499528 RepID=UPI001FE3C0D6|nr:hypothetical protein [Mesorhizobium silamurunense]
MHRAGQLAPKAPLEKSESSWFGDSWRDASDDIIEDDLLPAIGEFMTRRELALGAIVAAGSATAIAKFSASLEPNDAAMPLSPTAPSATLLSAPVELAGNWGHMLPHAAEQVIERMRHACLDGIRLLSDRQPMRLRVDEHTSGQPAIWLHPDGSSLAWIIVDIGERDWSKLAYQFGHELGHVLANSWQPDAKPAPPCQWLEEAMVEAFSLRGLRRLAKGWKEDPPFAGDNAFGDSIGNYSEDMIRGYSALADQQGLTSDAAAWFTDHRNEIEIPGLNPFARAMSVILLAEYDRTPECIEALGALNRWPGRSGVPIAEYLRRWKRSCAELHASPHLPVRLQELLHAS